jgi:hypothetical protein
MKDEISLKTDLNEIANDIVRIADRIEADNSANEVEDIKSEFSELSDKLKALATFDDSNDLIGYGAGSDAPEDNGGIKEEDGITAQKAPPAGNPPTGKQEPIIRTEAKSA